MDKYIVGITGGICSGKTVFSDTLSSCGGYVIDADKVSRIVMQKESTLCLLKKHFPQAFNENVLNRSLLRTIVFNDREKLLLLNSITHPLIEQEILKTISLSKDNLIFLVVPLLFETGYEKYCNYILSIVIDDQTRKARLIKRDNITLSQADKIIKSQTSDQEKIIKSDEVIYNISSINDLKQAAVKFYDKIKEKLNK